MADDRIDQTKRHSLGAGAGVGHEVSELRIGPIAWFLIGLTVATVVVCLLTAGLFNALKNRDEVSKRKLSPLAGERQKLPPEPRLQLAPSTEEQLEGNKPIDLKHEHPLEEMKRLRAEEEAKLNSYGWVDEKAGVVRIPIDEAKKLLLQKGVPTRK
jgi:hypothetical protein